MHLLESPEGWFVIVGVLVSGMMALSWIAFARLSMARIEKRIKEDGLPRPAPWDGIGYRAIWYAYAIVLPIGPGNWADDPLINVPTVRHYATPFDRILGAIFMVTGHVFVVLVFMGALVFDFY